MMATDLRIGAGKGWEEAQYRGSRNLIIWESKNVETGAVRSCRWGTRSWMRVGTGERI